VGRHDDTTTSTLLSLQQKKSSETRQMEDRFNSILDDKQERKKLRKAQREVSDQILEDKEELDKADSNAFNIHRDRNNELNKKILHSRELLNDSQNVKALARSVKNAAGHLDDISRRYDFTSFAAALTAQYSDDGVGGLFSWVDYGKDVGVLSRRREELCTMFGPIGEWSICLAQVMMILLLLLLLHAAAAAAACC
jgi:hypothetical protein